MLRRNSALRLADALTAPSYKDIQSSTPDHRSPAREPRAITSRKRAWMTRLLSVASLFAGLTPVPSFAANNPNSPQAAMAPLVLESQGSFFVGGRDLHSDTLSTNPLFPPVGTVTVDQMYVRYQIPAQRAKQPALVLIHGCCLSGKSWETTPDGRMGWDDYFVRRGFPLYLVDQSARGRSAADISSINAVRMGKMTIDTLPQVFAASREAVWSVFRFGPSYLKLHEGLQFPIEAKEELWKQMVPDWFPALAKPNPTVPALSALAKRLGSTVLISHSQSGMYPFQAAQSGQGGIEGIVSIEPGACPSPTSEMDAWVRIPTLVLFGDYVDASPFWKPRAESCRAFVDALNKAGGHAELIELPEAGIKGNSHMMMLDKNNLQVADWLIEWIDRNVGGQKR